MIMEYHTAGYFRGVLIFVIFVIIPGVTKFSTHETFHPRNFTLALQLHLRLRANSSDQATFFIALLIEWLCPLYSQGCLWRTHSHQWGDCDPATQYYSELSDSLPVSAVRVCSLTTKLSVYSQWNMEPRPHPSGMHDDTSNNNNNNNNNNNTANISITSRFSWRIQIPWDYSVFGLLYHWSITILKGSVDWMQCWSIPESVLCVRNPLNEEEEEEVLVLPRSTHNFHLSALSANLRQHTSFIKPGIQAWILDHQH